MRNLLYIGNKLSRHGSTVTAIEVLGQLLEDNGLKVYYASSKKNKVARLLDMVWTTILFKNRVDYVLIDTYSTWNFWYAFAVSQLCRFFSMKYIAILHGGNLPVRLTKNPTLCRMIFGNSYKNVAPSTYLQTAFSDAGFSTICIPNPFDASHFPFTTRNQVRPKLLWVRSLAPIYNPEMALNVLSLLAKKFPSATLCMVGPDKGLLDGLKSKAAAENLAVTFTGRLSKHDWAKLSSDYDIFINTSQTDNAPFSLVEATSLGLAVVSTDVGGIPHLFENRKSALLVAPNDAQGMTNMILELLENQSLYHEITNGGQHLIAQSNRDSVAQKWLEILK